MTFLKFLNDLNNKLNNVSICALSSVHAVSSNYENIYYASSKSALETGMRTLQQKKVIILFTHFALVLRIQNSYYKMLMIQVRLLIFFLQETY